MKNYSFFIVAVCLLIVCSGCSTQKEQKNMEITGQAQGTVDFTGQIPKIDISDIFAYKGQMIDYTTGLNYLLGDAYYEMQVDASGVRQDKPGSYDVEYTFQYGDNTYTDKIQVTIVEEQKGQIEEPQAGANTQNIQGDEESGTGETNIENNDTTSTKETERELITNPEDAVWEEEELRNAKIELLSGKVVTLVCTTERYIVSTETEREVVNRQGRKYEISKLVVEFSNGDKQVLETIEKKID